MKKKIQAVLLTASLLALVSCDQTAKHTKADHPLLGQWKIDSIASATNNGFGSLLLAMSLQDSAAYDLYFKPDSLKVYLKDTITSTTYSIDTLRKQLLLKEDSTVFNYQEIDSTHIHLTDKDSTTLFLRKK